MKTRTPIWDKLVKAYGSEYKAVVVLSSLARQKAKECNYQILDSQALAWVLTGEKPQTLIELEETSKQRKRSYMRDILAEVRDPDIVSSVISSLRISAENAALCYVYAEGTNKYQQQRIRILCNKIWYHKDQHNPNGTFSYV